mgnify:CR=1 FL=1
MRRFSKFKKLTIVATSHSLYPCFTDSSVCGDFGEDNCKLRRIGLIEVEEEGE